MTDPPTVDLPAMLGSTRVLSAFRTTPRQYPPPDHPQRPIRTRSLQVPDRASRVAALLVVIVLASLADLALTLTFLTSVGMAEANPVARAVIGTGSAVVVIGFKLSLSLGACTIFWIARRRPSGELGAWLGALVMAWLIVRWHAYIDHSHLFTGVLVGQQHQHDSRWVALAE